MGKRLLSLFERIGKSNRNTIADKIESFNDPFAKKIEWSSIAWLRVCYRNRKLLKTQNGSILFIPSVAAVLFPMPFIIMGGFLLWKFSLLHPTIDAVVLHPINTIRHYIHLLPRLLSSNMVWGHLFGLVFLLMGLSILFYSLRPIVFNKTNRRYSKGYWSKKAVSFNDIHAIQIITNAGNGPDSPTIYELNLALRNKNRIHVFGHPNQKAIIKDAAELSQILFVPVWDIT
jgi:hypothetical protein